MPTMRRAALLGLMTMFLAATVRAQTEPPPATSPPPAAQPQGQEPPPAPPGAPPAPATPAPVTPLAPTLAPDPGQGPALQLTERSPQGQQDQQQQQRPAPLYRQTWFWAAFGVAFVTAFIITFVVLRDKASEPPNTTFGNMHAF